MPKHKSKQYISSDSDDSGNASKSKVMKAIKSKQAKTTNESDGDSGDGGSIQLSKNRFVNVTEFKGKLMVNIREYYDADGEMKPGKKGISLPMDQWRVLRQNIDKIDFMVHKLS